MCSAVCFLAPYLHAAVVAMPQLHKAERKRSTLAQRRFSRTQEHFGRYILDGKALMFGIK